MSQEYAALFAPHRYSSAEAVMASSDAQNVDFGVDAPPDQHYIGHMAGSPNEQQGHTQIFNATPENLTSDYGNVHYPFGAPRPIKKEKAVLVALRKSKHDGAGLTVGPDTGVVSGGNSVGVAVRPLDAINATFGTLEGQKESVVSREYRFQLDGLSQD